MDDECSRGEVDLEVGLTFADKVVATTRHHIDTSARIEGEHSLPVCAGHRHIRARVEEHLRGVSVTRTNGQGATVKCAVEVRKAVGAVAEGVQSTAGVNEASGGGRVI